MLRSHFILAACTLALGTASVAAPAAAAGRRILVGAGIKAEPAYPGSNDFKPGFLPDFSVWREGEAMPAESPDEGVGPALIGRRGGTAFGPALRFAPRRSAADLPGLPEVKFGIEAGVFAETYLTPALRLRSELRQGIGAHRALTGELAADLVARQGLEGPLLTIGPRIGWGSAKYNRAYFGVPAGVPAGGPAGAPATGFAPYTPSAGINSLGAMAGAHVPLGQALGLFGYAGYSRLVGPAARSPIVAAGSRDQLSAGLALTFRFGA